MLAWTIRTDERFRLFLKRNAISPRLDRALRFYTRLGDGYVWALVALYIFLVLERSLALEILYRSLLAGAVSLLLYWAVKLTVRRRRPCNAVPGVHAEVPPLDKYSFPSGHTMNNLAAGFMVFSLLPQVGWIVILMPITWGLLRIYYGVHWLSDIVVGIVLGYLAFWLGDLLWTVGQRVL